jgi:hypothetical protein
VPTGAAKRAIWAIGASDDHLLIVRTQTAGFGVSVVEPTRPWLE